MATVWELEARGDLFRVDPGLPPAKQEERLIHASERAMKWILDTAPGLPSALNLELTPNEQITALFEEFCAGENLEVGTKFKCLQPHDSAVWELKTPEIRIFGWFYAPDCFIASGVNTADFIKDHGLYAGYIGETVRFRDAIDLDPPKFIPGDRPDAVVSNYSYP